MSLEDSINKLADAINNLANAYVKEQTLHVTIPQPVTTPAATEEAPAPTPKPRGRPPGTTNKSKPVEAPAPVITNDSDEADEFDAPAPEASPREYTMDDVRKACLALRDHDGGDKTRALDILKRIAGVSTVPDVKPVHYEEVVNECNKAMQS